MPRSIMSLVTVEHDLTRPHLSMDSGPIHTSTTEVKVLGKCLKKHSNCGTLSIACVEGAHVLRAVCTCPLARLVEPARSACMPVSPQSGVETPGFL